MLPGCGQLTCWLSLDTRLLGWSAEPPVLTGVVFGSCVVVTDRLNRCLEGVDRLGHIKEMGGVRKDT